ncbi:target of SBF [Amphichorda felina]
MADASPRLRDAFPSTEPTLPEHKPAFDTKGGTSIPSSPPTAGHKRSAPSLLPAFEPLSSSPGLPRPLKRQNTGSGSGSGSGTGSGTSTSSHARLKYPTPVPTSSTGILSSSPVRRPPFVRTCTSASEREPLGALPTVDLPENGEVLVMGRSSNSSHYQLSSNRLVSRVHVRARYIPAADPLEPSKMEIVCNGWNGLKLHCQGRTWELYKGDSFTSETEGTDIILDVQDARVMIQWPKRGIDALAGLSDSSWDDSPPRPHTNHAQGGAAPRGLQSSPLRRTMRIQSPESPTPGHLASSQRLQALFPSRREPPPPSREDEAGIQIYEDEPHDEEPELPPPHQAVDVGASMRTEATASFSSDLSDPDSDGENNPDEENDPVVHSFGPFGADISGRFASISTQSPRPKFSPKTSSRSSHVAARVRPSVGTLGMAPRRDIPCEPLIPEKPHKQQQQQQQQHAGRPSEPLVVLKEEEESPSPSRPVAPRAPKVEIDPAITNHVVNQLAFSRLSSTPLSTIMQNLPGDAKPGLTKDVLRDAIEATPAVGIIERQGKDAAGKALESEYYYVPEHDDDEQRRAAVVDGLRKPSLRNCRKQHKQYYWKRPRTP